MLHFSTGYIIDLAAALIFWLSQFKLPDLSGQRGVSDLNAMRFVKYFMHSLNVSLALYIQPNQQLRVHINGVTSRRIRYLAFLLYDFAYGFSVYL